MKKAIASMFALMIIVSSCSTPFNTTETYSNTSYAPESITQSLFSDKDATISEENIQRILSGVYTKPSNIRVAVVNLEDIQRARHYWNDEDYKSSRQKYLEVLTSNLKEQKNIESVSLIPKMLLPSTPTLTAIREAGVRMQADMIIVYAIEGGMYSKYNLFKGSTYKAFATTEVLAIDTRTGLIPFTRVISEDVTSKKEEKDFNEDEARKRIQDAAVIKTLDKICSDLVVFLQ